MNSECIEKRNNIIRNFKECQNLMVAIGNETRILIIFALLECDLKGMRVNEIAEKVHLTRPAVSHHLKCLMEAGIVNVRKDKTMNYYFMNADEDQWKKMLEFSTCIYEGIHTRCERIRRK